MARLDLMRPGSSRVRWVRSDRFHLTIKFLGETSTDLLPGIKAALGDVADATPPLLMGLTHGGVFPSAGPPRVIWLGLTPGAGLADLAARVDRGLLPLGFDLEKRPFHPHLTLGRAESGAFFDRALLERPLQAEPVKVNLLALVQSDLKPKGSVHETIEEWVLGG